jgi:CPA1 family monovalent cation:H+ antiporter
MDYVVTSTTGLFVAAIVVALVARRLRLPYTVALVLAGIGIALTPLHISLPLTPHLIFGVILPPLLFEAAINIPWPDLRRDALPILTLAVWGTLIAAAVVAAGMVWLLHWPAPAALLFGVLIAATDPVAVIAMFKDNVVGGRLRLLVECESLFNDGAAAVLFVLALAAVQVGGAPANMGVTLLVTVGGGVAVGLLVAFAAIAVAGRTSDHLVESLVTTVSAYGSFLIADRLHASGVLATVTAGLVIGNLSGLASDSSAWVAVKGREFVLGLWEFIAFVANSLVFLLIGVTVGGLSLAGFGWGNLAIVIALVLVGRAVTVYPICAMFAGSGWRIPLHFQNVLWWGGLRGALGLALALSLPETMAGRSDILIATFGVVVFSVVGQGLTMPLLLRRGERARG